MPKARIIAVPISAIALSSAILLGCSTNSTVTSTIDTTPTVPAVKTKQAVELEKSGRAVQVVNVKDVQLPNGKAVLIEYTSNSEPDAVTGKQIRLENSSYLKFLHIKTQ